jgi:glycosyltransferase involved in cell wall biosynthesis
LASRDDLLVHALAQLPDGVRLGLSGEDLAVRRLAEAYGIAGRVDFRAARGLSAGDPHAPGQTLAEIVENARSLGDRADCDRGDDAMLAGERVAILTNIPAPYRTGLWNRLTARLTRAGAELSVFFQGRGSTSRSWMANGSEGEFSATWLRNLELPVGPRGRLVPIDLERRLRAFRPTIVVSAGFSPAASMRVAALAGRWNAQFGLWSGDIPGAATARGRLRTVQRRWIAQRADFGIAYGFLAGEYLRGLHPGLPYVIGRNSSDVMSSGRDAAGGPLRLLFVGDLATPRKAADVAIRALAELPELDCRLTIVGGGRLVGEMQALAADDHRVRFTGAIPADAVRRQYQDADVFLFPTRSDVFGLALCEAMGSGLAAISSTAPGAIGDLGVDGTTCLLVDGHAPRDWAAAISRLAADPALRERVAARGQDMMAGRWTLDHSADAMVAGLRLGILGRAGAPR